MPVPEYAAIPIPDSMSFEEAAATPLVFLTAWHMLFARANLHAGEDVLVLAASSGVGMAAVQIAKLFHCRVIATAGGEAKLEKARALGADHVIDHYTQDISAEVKKITGKRGVDVVFEHVGAATDPRAWRASPRTAAWSPAAPLPDSMSNSICDFCLAASSRCSDPTWGPSGELYRVLKFVFQGKLKPVIDRVYPMSEIAAAHRRLENKEQFGKVVVVP